MGKINIKDFFDFRSQFLSSTIQAHSVGLKKDANGINDQWKLIKGNYEGINFPVTFKQKYGKKLTDILDTGWPSLYLISDRMKTILEDSQLTGWQTFPIKLYDENGNEIPGYHGFSITGKCSPITYESCEIIEKRMVPNGPICKFYKGMSIEDWDGSDLFTPEGTYDTLISKKAADVLKKNKITNLNLINLADSETDIDDVPKRQS